MEEYTTIYFDDGEGDSESAIQQRISDREYIIINPPVIIEGIDYGMTIEVLEKGGELWFDRIVKESDYITHSFLLSEKTINSPLLSEFFERIVKRGGAWETIGQGYVRLFIPKDMEFNLVEEWKEVFGTTEC